MDVLLNVRRLSKRCLLCFYFSCVMFFVCTFYTFYIESFSTLPDSSIQNDDTKNIPLPTVGDNLSPKKHSGGNNVSPQLVEIVLPAVSWASDSLNSTRDRITILDELTSNKSSRKIPMKRSGAVQSDTKYIYAGNSSASNSDTISLKAAHSLLMPTTSTPLPADTCQRFTMKDSKLILLWTPFFGQWEYLLQENFDKCMRCRNCRVTKDRTKLGESDAVVFHARDMSMSDLPPFRHAHQRWIFYCLESPPYSDFPGLTHMRNMFNWTMTYRRDSNIVTQYGTVTKIRPSQKLDLQSLQWAFTNKSKSVVWMSSHCPTDGGRDNYVKELRKYIDVDVYGSCGESFCPLDGTNKCLRDFGLKYKFFLAFENTICKDYVTEKLFRTLEYNIVPVVFGGASYAKFAPPASYIDALSFKSPKHLAFFLAGVGNDFKMYSTYFRWRQDYSVGTVNHKECDLCSLLHRRNLRSSSYKDLRKWWVVEANCRTWKPNRST